MNSHRATQIVTESDISAWDWSCDAAGEEAAGSEGSVEYLPRTQTLILEFKQFKAAQLIQRNVRGWLVRSHMRKLWLAAAVIQKWWRRFMAQRILLVLAESKLQLAVVSHHNSCSTLIQKTYRGWWTRNHVNDLTKLKSLHESLLGSIIHILSAYLHKVKRNDQLPGFFDENLPQECLEMIDQLMAAEECRFFNAFSCHKIQKTLTEIKDLRTAFKNSTYYTQGPICGFERRKLCDDLLLTLKADEDKLENDQLIRAFVCQKHEMDLKTKFARKVPDDGADKSMKLTLDATIKAFLKRIVLDMNKWDRVDNKVVLPRVISNANEVKAILEAVKENLYTPCNCGGPYTDM